MPQPSSSFHCFTLTLLILPAIVLLIYLLTSFPHVPESIVVHPSLASLVNGSSLAAESCIGDRVKAVYPESIWGARESDQGYANLPNGRTRYWIIGPEDGTNLVLIHGLSVPSIIWRDIAPELASRGYRVLLYDLYGRGYSDAPQLTYSASLYATQLALLMQYVGWSNANIVGISMGGGIATSFSVQFPHLVSGKIALLAAAGIIDASDMSRTSRFLSSPLLQLITSSYPFRMYLKHLANTSNASSADHRSPLGELIRIQSAYLPGYNLAIASSIRDGPIRNLAPAFAQLGRQTKKWRKERGEEEAKILLVWGTRDTVVPYHYASRVLTLLGGSPSSHAVFPSLTPSDDHDRTRREWFSASQLRMSLGRAGKSVQDKKQKEESNTEPDHVALATIEGAGHGLTESHPEFIVELLDRFFRAPGTQQ